MSAIRTAFLDLLFNTLLVFVVLFSLAFTQMRPPAHDQAIEPKAELVLEMTWPDGSLDDVDMWLLLPDGRKVGFNRKDVGVATLDRDDRGAYGDIYWDGQERKLIRSNREVIAVRGILPGRYVVNAHYYGRFTQEYTGFQDEWARPDVPVKVKLTKINPRVQEVGVHEATLFAVGQQVTVFAFEVQGADEMPTLDRQADLPFVEATK
jgi:hypothetical protein